MKTFKLASVCLLAVTSAFGECGAISGQIEGTITDPSGAEVPSAMVDVINKGTGYKRSAETDQSVLFRCPLLPLGTSSLTADAKGFMEETRSEIPLSAGEIITINIGVLLAGTERTIVVTSEAPVVEPGRTDLGSTVSSNSVENISLVSRNPYNFILIQPNVSGPPNSEFGVPRKLNPHAFLPRITNTTTPLTQPNT